MTVSSNLEREQKISKEELKNKALEMGFQLFGVSDLERLEKVEFPAGRGLMRPSEVMKDARSAVVMGMIIWDEAMNTAVVATGSSDFSGGQADYINLYYEALETRAWHLADWLNNNKGIKALPTHVVHEKVAAHLAGLRIHRT